MQIDQYTNCQQVIIIFQCIIYLKIKMVILEVSLMARTQNVGQISMPEDEKWHLKIRCSHCHQQWPNQISFSKLDQEVMPKDHGTANFIAKCKNCQRKSSIKIQEKSPYSVKPNEDGMIKGVIYLSNAEAQILKKLYWETRLLLKQLVEQLLKTLTLQICGVNTMKKALHFLRQKILNWKLKQLSEKTNDEDISQIRQSHVTQFLVFPYPNNTTLYKTLNSNQINNIIFSQDFQLTSSAVCVLFHSSQNFFAISCVKFLQLINLLFFTAIFQPFFYSVRLLAINCQPFQVIFYLLNHNQYIFLKQCQICLEIFSVNRAIFVSFVCLNQQIFFWNEEESDLTICYLIIFVPFYHFFLLLISNVLMGIFAVNNLTLNLMQILSAVLLLFIYYQWIPLPASHQIFSKSIFQFLLEITYPHHLTIQNLFKFQDVEQFAAYSSKFQTFYTSLTLLSGFFLRDFCLDFLHVLHDDQTCYFEQVIQILYLYHCLILNPIRQYFTSFFIIIEVFFPVSLSIIFQNCQQSDFCCLYLCCTIWDVFNQCLLHYLHLISQTWQYQKEYSSTIAIYQAHHALAVIFIFTLIVSFEFIIINSVIHIKFQLALSYKFFQQYLYGQQILQQQILKIPIILCHSPSYSFVTIICLIQKQQIRINKIMQSQKQQKQYDLFSSDNLAESKNKVQKPKEESNAVDKLMNDQWKSQQDYKRMIVQLELQNEKYRNQLYQLGETVNKILQKTKLPQSNKINTPNLQGQLQLVKKQLHNVNQFIEIYQRQLNQLQGKKQNDQLQNLTSTQQILKHKTEELTTLKKEVKQLTHKNKGLQYKLLQYNRKNKAKSVDQQALQLKQLINENKNLKIKLEELSNLQEKKQVWLKNNIESAKELEKKIQQQETKFPQIKSRALSRSEQSTSSLPKLKSQKKIYTKWLQSSKGKGNSKLQKQLEDLEKINKMVQEKIQNTTKEIKDIQQNIQKIKEKVQANQQEQIGEEQLNSIVKKKEYGCMVSKKIRKVRRDWVGKFDSIRFSDSRAVREQARIYKILFNTVGYFQFFYYAVKDPKRTFVGKLPFDTAMLSNGKQSTFTVQKPDYIKFMRIKINLRTQRILEMQITSNLGIKGQFICEAPKNIPTNGKVTTSSKQDQTEVYYDVDIKPTEAITTMFGSYGVKTDEKKNVTSVWLQGLGAEIIEDFVEELI